MNQWNPHGWDRLSGRNPEVIRARNDILQRLNRVPEPHRTNWYGRLKSKLDHPHFSTRLEIQLHDFFKARGWDATIEPKLPETNNQPDFLLKRGMEELIVEAKVVLDPKSVAEQETRLYELADSLTVSLKRSVSIHASKKLPPISLPGKKIAAEIERRASNAKEELLEFHVAGEHCGYPYDLEVAVLLDEKPSESADIGSTSNLRYFNDSNKFGRRIRSEMIKKTKKYGDPGIPFVVAVWPKATSYNANLDDDFNDDSIALLGDEIWGEFDSRLWVPQGGTKAWIASRIKNGVFTLQREDGTSRYSRLSAVIIYDFTYNYVDVMRHYVPSHSIRVYHNPSAKIPVGSHVFKGIPQARVNLMTGRLEWERQAKC